MSKNSMPVQNAMDETDQEDLIEAMGTLVDIVNRLGLSKAAFNGGAITVNDEPVGEWTVTLERVKAP